MMSRRETIAAALANARNRRQGLPATVEVLGSLSSRQREELLDEAAAVERAVDQHDLHEFKRAIEDICKGAEKQLAAGERLEALADRLKKSLAETAP
jgi:tRNA A37 methylthiotransferase MiaB